MEAVRQALLSSKSNELSTNTLLASLNPEALRIVRTKKELLRKVHLSLFVCACADTGLCFISSFLSLSVDPLSVC